MSLCACICVCVQVCTPGYVYSQKRALGVLCHRTPCSSEAGSVSVSLSLGNQHTTTLTHYSLMGKHARVSTVSGPPEGTPCIGIYGTSSLCPRC